MCRGLEPQQGPLTSLHNSSAAPGALIPSFSFLVTDDTAATNHPIKVHTILSRLTDTKKRDREGEQGEEEEESGCKDGRTEYE